MQQLETIQRHATKFIFKMILLNYTSECSVSPYQRDFVAACFFHFVVDSYSQCLLALIHICHCDLGLTYSTNFKKLTRYSSPMPSVSH